MTFDRRQAVISAIQHRETDCCPYTFVFEEDVGKRLDAWYGGRNWRNQFRNYIAWCTGIDDGRVLGRPLTRDLYGTAWRMDLRPFHLEEPAIKEPTLRGYRFPDPDQLFPDNWAAKFRATIAESSDCFTVGYFGFGLFERAWTLRGFENLLMDSAAEPAFFADLIAAIAEHQGQILDRLLTLPLDGMMFSDDWGDQRGVIIGPDRWRAVLKPHLKTLYAKVKTAGKFVLSHCCGSIVDIIPDAAEIGLDVFESVQPEARDMNPYELKTRYGNRITFWGGLGSQRLIPFGAPEEIRAEIRTLTAHMKKGGGYILSCAKALQPETPVENAVAILEEFMAWGERGTSPRSGT